MIFFLSSDLGLKFIISPFWCRAVSRWRREVTPKHAGCVDRDGKFDRVGRVDLVDVALRIALEVWIAMVKSIVQAVWLSWT